MTSFREFGLMMNQAMPARCAPPSGLSAVSSAAHSLPLAYMTCCIRVSFESGVEMTSLCAGSPPNRRCQQPVAPLNNSVVVSLMQLPSGVAVVASVPEPGWCCCGGTPYWFTLRTWLLSVSAGAVPSSEDVLVSVHTTSWFDVWLPPMPLTGFVASVVAFELRKYSVPPASRLKEPMPGVCAGQTVKPDCVGVSLLGTLTRPDVSRC